MMRLTQRGDTLVEVVIGLAILASVMAGGFVAANRAYQAGVNARERTALVSEAQQQLEALKSFRDSHTWSEFRYGSNGTVDNSTACNAAGQYCGVDDHAGQVGTFYMVRKDVKQANGTTLSEWVPSVVADDAAALQSSLVPTSQLALVAMPGQPAGSYKFRATYEADALGGGNRNVGHLFMMLTDISRLEGTRL